MKQETEYCKQQITELEQELLMAPGDEIYDLQLYITYWQNELKEAQEHYNSSILSLIIKD